MIWKRAVHIATAPARSTNNQEELSVLDSIPKSEPDDVRWEKVDHVRPMLANGTYRFSRAGRCEGNRPNVREWS
jgi:hypothetical protein